MSNSVYHIINKAPAIYQDEIAEEYENLAIKLVESGRLRIDTGHYSNFVRFSDPSLGVNLMFSTEEIINVKLLPYTRMTLKSLYSQTMSEHQSENKVKRVLIDLKNQSVKLLQPSPDLTMRLARVLVQSAHPIVIEWLIHDRVEVFITYSHNIGDMMDIKSWQEIGANSGLQSTDGKNVAVFVSCGGDPFAENSKEHPTYGDGWAAIARMQIIAAQELGHFADIKRDDRGRQVGRHSANFSGTKSPDRIVAARKNDLKICDQIFEKLNLIGLGRLIEYETKLRFYFNNKLSGLKVITLQLLYMFYRYRFKSIAKKEKDLLFINNFAEEKYLGLMLKAMILDMKFNLNPVADVYKRSDKVEEEAIKCIEALARVPQQVMKWGYITTSSFMHNLYQVYYNEVIISLIESYSAVTGINYKRQYIDKLWSMKALLKKFEFFNKNDIKLVPVRDLD